MKGMHPDAEALSAFLDGELSPEDERAMRERLAADPQLAGERDRLRGVNHRMHLRCEPDPNFLARHRRRREALPVPDRTFGAPGFRIAAAFLLPLVFATLLILPDRQEAAPEIAAFESEALAPPPLPGLDPDSGGESVLQIAIGFPPEDPPNGR